MSAMSSTTLSEPERDKMAMDWGIEASGLTALLVRIRDEYTTLPIYITENGAAFDDYVDPNGEVLDHNRVAYLQEHISAVHDAIDVGVNVQGYFVWSLLDDFEWSCGYSRRFGIVWVDFFGQPTPQNELRLVPRHDSLELRGVRHVHEWLPFGKLGWGWRAVNTHQSDRDRSIS